jgi:uracil-DNA glycosylase
MRVTAMWLHAPTKKNFEDAQWNFQQACLEAMHKKFVLLLGSGATKFFLNKTATTISGIPMKSDLLGAEYVMGTLNPNSALAGVNGEVLLGIKKFALLYKEKR